jgi:phosphoserine phosphatase
VRPRGQPPFEVVFFDMDGTLTDRVSSWEWVHRHFGVDNKGSWEAFCRGEIDDLEFMRRDIALWKDAAKGEDIPLQRIREALHDIPLIPGARRLVEALHAQGTRTIIVTGGLDLLAERVCQETGIQEHIGNGLCVDHRDVLLDEGILRVPVNDKGQPVRHALQRMGIRGGRAAAIGNSAQDVPMFRECALGIAFDPIDDGVRAGADVVIEEKDLTLAMPHLAGVPAPRRRPA